MKLKLNRVHLINAVRVFTKAQAQRRPQPFEVEEVEVEPTARKNIK